MQKVNCRRPPLKSTTGSFLKFQKFKIADPLPFLPASISLAKTTIIMAAVAIDVVEDADDTTSTIWRDLIEYIVQQHHGYIHAGLRLRRLGLVVDSNQSTSATSTSAAPKHPEKEDERPAAELQQRGVFAETAIPAGELLIRIPVSSIVRPSHGGVGGGNATTRHSGNATTDSDAVKNSSSTTTTSPPPAHDADGGAAASSWLRCLVALWALLPSQHPYVRSLPRQYTDTLWDWSDEEIEVYLAGTQPPPVMMVGGGGSTSDDGGGGWKMDRDIMKRRFRDQVRPYLKRHGIIKVAANDGDDTADFDRFVYCCQTLSTRGFHDPESSSTTPPPFDHTTATNDESSSGPFLIPVMDLLNHGGSDLDSICTKLRREGDDFLMFAERNIEPGEELLHSYDGSSSLLPGQFLANFGFVPKSLLLMAVATDKTATSRQQPIILSKRDIWTSSIYIVEELQLPAKLSQIIDPDDAECWEIVQLDRTRDAPFVPDDIVLSLSTAEDRHHHHDNDIGASASSSFLTDELVTAACVPFLPKCAYGEITNRTLLDESILEDDFLGSLVVATLHHVIAQKLQRYTPIPDSVRRRCLGMDHDSCSMVDDDTDDDAVLLAALLQLKDPSQSTLRLMHGLAIRLEEQKTLHLLHTMLARHYPIELDRYFQCTRGNGGTGASKRKRSDDAHH
jgi:hypothetical protein